MITVITPTCDRPAAFALCEHWISRQTIKPDEWIVADGGRVPANCTMGQIHVHEARPPGAENFAHNLLNCIARATGDVIVIAEDDDWLAPIHIETLAAAFKAQPNALLSGADYQHYYHVGCRVWRTMNNARHSSLCQTAMQREALPLFEAVTRRCLTTGKFYIDSVLWQAVPSHRWARTVPMTCVGIKGLSGQAGLGIGHRPGARWTPDHDLAQLLAWIGEDAELYANYFGEVTMDAEPRTTRPAVAACGGA